MPSVILRPAQPWGNVVQLGNKTYSLTLTRRRAGGRLTFSPATTAWLANVEAADLAGGEPPLEDAVYNAMGGYANYRIPLGGYCLLPIGARTLAGALVPMVGPAPLGVNLIEGDYSRTAGIKGVPASSKSIALNYNNGTYGSQNSRLGGVWLSERDTTGSNARFFTGNITASGRFFLRNIGGAGVGTDAQYAINGFTASQLPNYTTGLLVAGRQNANDQLIYNAGTTQTNASGSQAPNAFAMTLFKEGVGTSFTDARIAMFTDSAYIDPAVLDTNMTAAINAITAALA